MIDINVLVRASKTVSLMFVMSDRKMIFFLDWILLFLRVFVNINRFSHRVNSDVAFTDREPILSAAAASTFINQLTLRSHTACFVLRELTAPQQQLSSRHATVEGNHCCPRGVLTGVFV